MASRVHSPALRGGLHIDPAIETAAVRLAEAADAEAIVLFGSRARGDNDGDSDWDLCVILPDNVEWGRFTPVTLWPLVSDLGVPIQVVPIRRSVFEEKKTGINNLSHDIARDGVVIHGRLTGLPHREFCLRSGLAGDGGEGLRCCPTIPHAVA
jgi:predicted nucleotidyltransferase